MEPPASTPSNLAASRVYGEAARFDDDARLRVVASSPGARPTSSRVAGGAPGTVLSDEEEDAEDKGSNEQGRSVELAASISARAVAAVQRARGLSWVEPTRPPTRYPSEESSGLMQSNDSDSGDDGADFAYSPGGGDDADDGWGSGAIGGAYGDTRGYEGLDDQDDGDDDAAGEEFGYTDSSLTPPLAGRRAVVVGGAVAFPSDGAGHAAAAALQLGLAQSARRSSPPSPPRLAPSSAPSYLRPSGARAVRASLPLQAAARDFGPREPAFFSSAPNGESADGHRREEPARGDDLHRATHRAATASATAASAAAGAPTEEPAAATTTAGRRVSAVREAAALSAAVLNKARDKGDVAAKTFDASRTPSGLALAAAVAHRDSVASAAASRHRQKSGAKPQVKCGAVGVVSTGGNAATSGRRSSQEAQDYRGAKPPVLKHGDKSLSSTGPTKSPAVAAAPVWSARVRAGSDGDNCGAHLSYAQRARVGCDATDRSGAAAPFAAAFQRPRLKGPTSAASSGRKRGLDGGTGFGRGASEGRPSTVTTSTHSPLILTGLTSYATLASALMGGESQRLAQPPRQASQSMPRPHGSAHGGHSALKASTVARDSRSSSRPAGDAPEAATSSHTRLRRDGSRCLARHGKGADGAPSRYTLPAPRSVSPGALFGGGFFCRSGDEDDTDGDDGGEEKENSSSRPLIVLPSPPTKNRGVSTYAELLTMSVDRGSVHPAHATSTESAPAVARASLVAGLVAGRGVADASKPQFSRQEPGRRASMERQRTAAAASVSRAAAGCSVEVGAGLTAVPVSTAIVPSAPASPPKVSAAEALRAHAAAAATNVRVTSIDSSNQDAASAAAIAAASSAPSFAAKSVAKAHRLAAKEARGAMVARVLSLAGARATASVGSYAMLVATAEAGRLNIIDHALTKKAASATPIPPAAFKAQTGGHGSKRRWPLLHGPPVGAPLPPHASSLATAPQGRGGSDARRDGDGGGDEGTSLSSVTDSSMHGPSRGDVDDDGGGGASNAANAPFSSYKSLRAAFVPATPSDTSTVACWQADGAVLQTAPLFGNFHLTDGDGGEHRGSDGSKAESNPIVVTVAVPNLNREKCKGNLVGGSPLTAEGSDDRACRIEAARAECRIEAARDVAAAVMRAGDKASAEAETNHRATAAAESQLQKDHDAVARRRARPTSPPRENFGSYSFLLAKNAQSSQALPSHEHLHSRGPSSGRQRAAKGGWHDAYSPPEQLRAAWRK